VRIKSNEAISMVQAYSLPVSTFPSWPCCLHHATWYSCVMKRRSRMEKIQPIFLQNVRCGSEINMSRE
jgi:hypothetical protein